MKLGKMFFGIVAAAVLLGALVGSASARNLSVSNQTLRGVFREVRFTGGFGNITCAVTAEGSFHQRTIAKVVGSLVGYITRADLGACAEGAATILRETLPWHVRYLSFTGMLPNITAITANIVGIAFRLREGAGIACLAASTAARPATMRFNRDVVTRAVASAEIGGTVPTDCFADGTFTSDRAAVTVLNSTTRITITLI
jgi:hypothetical protein